MGNAKRRLSCLLKTWGRPVLWKGGNFFLMGFIKYSTRKSLNSCMTWAKKFFFKNLETSQAFLLEVIWGQRKSRRKSDFLIKVSLCLMHCGDWCVGDPWGSRSALDSISQGHADWFWPLTELFYSLCPFSLSISLALSLTHSISLYTVSHPTPPPLCFSCLYLSLC